MLRVWIWSVALILTLFTAVNAWAVQSRKIEATASAPIPTAYSSSNAQSRVWPSGYPTVGTHKHLHVNNTTGSAIACMEGEDSTAAPDPTAPLISEEIKLPATTQYIFDNFESAKRLYCRSDSGSAVTSGSILIHVY